VFLLLLYQAGAPATGKTTFIQNFASSFRQDAGDFGSPLAFNRAVAHLVHSQSSDSFKESFPTEPTGIHDFINETDSLCTRMSLSDEAGKIHYHVSIQVCNQSMHDMYLSALDLCTATSHVLIFFEGSAAMPNVSLPAQDTPGFQELGTETDAIMACIEEGNAEYMRFEQASRSCFHSRCLGSSASTSTKALLYCAGAYLIVRVQSTFMACCYQRRPDRSIRFLALQAHDRPGPMSSIEDTRMDVCVYFISPHNLRPVDVTMINRIGQHVPVVPVIGKV
jgi:septin family protein